uniref:Ribosomal protein S19 n=1 Tax=Tupiella akineta TaxID=160070 RepID=Q6UVU3_TUPAK|nr:ribosomal protein S19 [Tupiella akineta]AAQ18731.1 ribosomal protein S19 [Tupiella akineta]
MTRSTYKLPYIARSLKRIGDLKNGLFGPLAEVPKQGTTAQKQAPNKGGSTWLQTAPHIQVYQRSSTIVPGMIGNTVKIHTGHKFVKLSITEHTVGYKLGEFAPTKKRALYKKKKKR